MRFLTELYWNDPGLLWLAITAMITALVSIFADRRRQVRKRADDVGFMPWSAITVFSILIALMATAIALKSS